MRLNLKLGVAFILLGAVLILSALSLFIFNRLEDAQAGDSSEELLIKLKDRQNDEINIAISVPEEFEEESDATHDVSEPETMPTESLEMKEVEIDGHSYVGYISIPDLDLELPIMSEWDYDKLKIAPCRQKGSSKTDDLVIMAHNYYNHFGRLWTLNPGDEVIITDMDGEDIFYTVSYMEKIDPENPGAILGSNSDLVLYTCTVGGNLRQVVFLDRNV